MFWMKKLKLMNSSEIIEKEKEYINNSKSMKNTDKIWGLGISGGGIRSAVVGLGVMQALVNAPGQSILSKIDYLSTLTGNLPADIYSYKSANPAFPNQTTADQFFNEEQFEAYRELGYQLVWQMLDSNIGKNTLGF